MTATVKPTAKATAGRGWAYTGAILGGAVSVAANVAHSYVPPADAPATWTPHGGAVVGAIFWPVALFVAVEIFARIAWPTGRRWTALRFLGLLPVAAVAAVVSYRHLSGLLGFYGEDPLTVVIGPLAVDGLMVMATGALIATGVRATAKASTAIETIPQAPHVSTPVPAPAPDPTPDTMPVVTAEPVVSGPVKAAPKRTAKRQPSAAERVAKAAARTPNATPAQIAARLKLSERTVQRHMPKPDDSVTTRALKIA
jgi:hypothetical protein